MQNTISININLVIPEMKPQMSMDETNYNWERERETKTSTNFTGEEFFEIDNGLFRLKNYKLIRLVHSPILIIVSCNNNLRINSF